MSSVFSNNVVTQAGLNLIASATAANPIVYVKALSSPSVPSIPDDESSYLGIDGVIDASSSTDNTARIIARYGNNTQYSPQPVKAIAIMAKLASQSDSQALVFAYCSDANSQIVFPPSSAPSQKTRFAFNITFDGQSTVEVVETGCAALSDLERLVSCHRAGNPNAGDDQQIRGSKTFLDEAVFSDTVIHENTVYLDADILPGQANTYSIGNSIGNRLNNVYVKTVHAGVLIAGNNIQDNWNLEICSTLVPEASTVTGRISTVTIGSGDRRYSGVYANRLDGLSLYLWESSNQGHGVLTYDLSSDRVTVDKGLRARELEGMTLILRESNDPDSIKSTVQYNARDGFYFADSISTRYSLMLYESNRQVAGTVKYDVAMGFEVDDKIVPAQGQTNLSLGASSRPWDKVYVTSAVISPVAKQGGDSQQMEGTLGDVSHYWDNAYLYKASVKYGLWVQGRVCGKFTAPTTWDDTNSAEAVDIAVSKKWNEGSDVDYNQVVLSRLGTPSSFTCVDNFDLSKYKRVPPATGNPLHMHIMIGGLILAMPSGGWQSNNRGATFNAGDSITDIDHTDTNTGIWYVAKKETDASTGSTESIADTSRPLGKGTYRCLESFTINNPGYFKAPILLQRIA